MEVRSKTGGERSMEEIGTASRATREREEEREEKDFVGLDDQDRY